jgi:hypothetical protein
MSWHFSRALAEEFLQANRLGGEPLPPLSGNPTPQGYLSPDRMTAFSRLSRFGMTFKPLTDTASEAVLTWFLAGFPVRTSASQEKAQESTGNDPECGGTWRGSLAKFDPVSCSWKTAQLSLIEDLEPCSVTWPRSGMTVDGLCLELPTLGRRTSVTGSGLWPTPVASDTSSRTKPYAQGGTPLSLAVKWPTPTVCGNYNRKGASATSGDGLATAVRMWPTPQASDNRNRGTTQTPAIARRIDAGKQVMLSMCMDGPLNPTWTEWLMGWPLGWTDLRPLETGKSRNAPQQHGECLEACK